MEWRQKRYTAPYSQAKKIGGKIGMAPKLMGRGGGFVIETARVRYKIPRFRYAGLGWGAVAGLRVWEV